jgi:hypothetical protein
VGWKLAAGPDFQPIPDYEPILQESAMTVYSRRLPVAVLAVVAASAVCFHSQQSFAECSGDYGTEVKFVESPAEAAKLATKQEKLVFVLHVSGNFENPEFT